MIGTIRSIEQGAAKQPAAALLDHLSWSSLQTHRTCPRRFYYRYILKAAEETRAATLIFGGAIHKAAEFVHDARIAGEEIPTVEALLAAYEREWNGALTVGPPVTFTKTENAESLHELAGRMLVAYRSHAAERQDGEVISIEHEATINLLPDTPPLVARLDLMEISNGDLLVSDLKTSRSKWNEDKVRENLPQLILYAHAAMPILRELGATRVVPRFVVLTKAKEPFVQVLEPPSTAGDVTRLKEMVSDTWAAIKGGAFPRREGWQCKGCPYMKRCLGR